MSWATPSIYAPPTMTDAQLINIYNCTFTDWGQVGGIPGHAIQRYLPQSNSGTYSFFLSDLLGGFNPATVSSTTPPAGSTFPCPAVINTQLDNAGKPLEENTGNELDAAGYQTAIIAYSVGQWVYQANNHLNPTLDLRNGIKLGGMTPNVSGSAVNYLRWNVSGVWEPNSVNGANPSAPLNETQTTVYIAANGGTLNYPGIRYVWYVLDDVQPELRRLPGHGRLHQRRRRGQEPAVQQQRARQPGHLRLLAVDRALVVATPTWPARPAGTTAPDGF